MTINIKISKFKHYLSNIILLWTVILFYRTNLYYSNFLRTETQLALFYIALAYTLFGFIYTIYTPPEKIQESKGTTVFGILKKIIICIYTKKDAKIERHEKIIFLFLAVKIFFLPIMLNFFFSNLFSFKSQLSNLVSVDSLLTVENFNLLIFPFLLTTIFLMDTLWFSFGYSAEAGFLKNKIVSVEPTILGWAVALACYPPFNSLLVGYIDWFANDYVFFQNASTTFIMRIIIVLLLLVYVSATLALGTKSSNLTNRGIVARGPYAFIRHPAYISKNLAWWLTIIPVLSLTAVLSMSAWSFIYHLRTSTEEKHLMKDSDYIEYCKKVRYRYIPGVY